MSFLPFLAHSLRPKDLPSSGLALVFGGVGAGKSAGIVRPLSKRFAASGRQVEVFSGRPFGQDRLFPGAQPAGSLVNEAQTFFGSEDTALAERVAQDLETESRSLDILIFQTVAAIGPQWRPLLFKHARAEIFLRCKDVDTPRHFAERQFSGAAAHRPFELSSLRTARDGWVPWTEAIICTRRDDPDGDSSWWKASRARLRLELSPAEQSAAAAAAAR